MRCHDIHTLCRHTRLGTSPYLKSFSDDVLKEIQRFLNTWDTQYCNWNVTLYPQHNAVDINGGHKVYTLARVHMKKRTRM